MPALVDEKSQPREALRVVAPEVGGSSYDKHDTEDIGHQLGLKLLLTLSL